MTLDPPNLFVAACQCCGAQGPCAITRGAAIVQWDQRRAPGDTTAFCDLADSLAGRKRADAHYRNHGPDKINGG